MNIRLIETSVFDSKIKAYNVRCMGENYSSIIKIYDKFKNGTRDLRYKKAPLEIINGSIKESSVYRNCIFNADCLNLIGAFGLVLSGLNIEDETKKSIKFMQDIALANAPRNWVLPIPPLEIMARPLVYVSYFHLEVRVSESRWEQEKQEMREIILGMVGSFLSSWKEPVG